jgi:hypothetical protein
MSEDSLIRLTNLKALGLTATELSEKVGGRYTYWRDMLHGNKSFGEKIARKIEDKLKLPRGSLDAADSRTERAIQPILAAAPVPTHSRYAQLLADYFDEMVPRDSKIQTPAFNRATDAIAQIVRECAEQKPARDAARNPKKLPG